MLALTFIDNTLEPLIPEIGFGNHSLRLLITFDGFLRNNFETESVPSRLASNQSCQGNQIKLFAKIRKESCKVFNSCNSLPSNSRVLYQKKVERPVSFSSILFIHDKSESLHLTPK